MISITRNKWHTRTVDELSEILCSATSISNAFLRPDIHIAVAPLRKLIQSKLGFVIKSNTAKYEITNKLSQLFGDGSTVNITRKKSAKSLKSLAKDVLARKFTKMATNVIVATNVYLREVDNFYTDSCPFEKDVQIDYLGECQPYRFYSKPEFVPEINDYVFYMLDAHHLFVNARSTICSKGISGLGVHKEAWHEIATSDNDCGLSPPIVMHLMDRQSNAYAKKVFGEDVEKELHKNGRHREADFTRVFRRWYEAEDDAGISVSERHNRRIALRSMLLGMWNLSFFPPPGNHVAGMPTTMYEGLLTNIDRRVQLSSFAASGKYNVRTLGSLDSENFFGTFQDIDPRGQGVLLPDDVPAAIDTPCYIIRQKMDDTLPYYVNTSRPNVYPLHPLSSNNPSTRDVDNATQRRHGISNITIRNHAFDEQHRISEKPKRKRSDIRGPEQPKIN